MTKTEIEQKIAEVKAQGDALQKHSRKTCITLDFCVKSDII